VSGTRCAALALAFACLAGATARADEPVPVHDEQYRLNITEQRIDRGPYDAALEVGLKRPPLRIGVAVSAAHFVALLRGVRGDVRFHGDLSRITAIVASHPGRAASAKETP
jgi:hypothetical protein